MTNMEGKNRHGLHLVSPEDVATNIPDKVNEELRAENERLKKENEDLKKQLLEAKDKEGKDPLTDIFNRLFLKSTLEGYIQELNTENDRRENSIEAVVVVYFDIEDFKKLNDNYGHLVGDKALKLFAKSLKDITRAEDHLFRVGGDEFIAILKISKPDVDFSIMFNRKKEEIKKLSFDYEGQIVSFSVSMGYEVLHRGDKRTAEEIIKTADKKMYKDKQEKNPESDYSI